MNPMVSHFRAHPRLLTAVVIGTGVALLLPALIGPVTWGLLGWNVALAGVSLTQNKAPMLPVASTTTPPFSEPCHEHPP